MNKGIPFVLPKVGQTLKLGERNVEADKRLRMAAQARLDGHNLPDIAKFFGYKSGSSLSSCAMTAIGFSFFKGKYVPDNQRAKEQQGSESSSIWNKILCNSLTEWKNVDFN